MKTIRLLFLVALAAASSARAQQAQRALTPATPLRAGLPLGSPLMVSTLYPVDLSLGNINLTLPAAPPDKSQVAVKVIAVAGSNACSILCGSGAVINRAGGATSLSLSLLNQTVTLQYAAAPAIWYVVASDLPLSGLDARYAVATPPARVTADAGLPISGAGVTHLTANNLARTSRKVTLAAGSGPYLAQLILDTPTASTGVAADANGAWQDIRLEFAAGGNAGVQILAADGVTVLFSEAVTPGSTMPAYAVAAQFVYPSSTWRLHDAFLTP